MFKRSGTLNTSIVQKCIGFQQTMWLLVGTLICQHSLADEQSAIVSLVPSSQTVFELNRHKSYRLSFSTSKALRSVEMVLVSGDGDKVKTFHAKDLEKGVHHFQWDGLDDQGEQVPDEAYVPLISATTQSGELLLLDPRSSSGGVLLEGLGTQLLTNGHISYSLNQPARVLVRVGLKSGPLMNTVVAWEPRSQGKNVQAWNGFDATGVVYLPSNPDVRVLVLAYSLPDGAVITQGNEEKSYLAYRAKKAWPSAEIDPDKIVSARDGKRISPFYFLPRSLAYEPKVLFTVRQSLNKNAQGKWLVDKPIMVSVDLSKEDKWLMQQSQYEISFFVDGKFVAEEETGYTPLSWQWDPGGLSPGEHIFTVNISGLWGHVGVHNMVVEVP